MLDKDVVRTQIIMNCGCLLYHDHYINSGLRYDNARDLIYGRYGYDINNHRIDDFHNDWDNLNKLMDKIGVKRLCLFHTNELMSHVVNGTRDYFSNEKTKKGS